MTDAEPQLEPQKVQELTPERQLLCARFSSDGMHLLAGGMDAQLHRWQLAEVEVEIREKKVGDLGVLAIFGMLLPVSQRWCRG